MNAHAPPQQKRRLCGAALRKLRLLGAYHLAAFHAKLFEKPFWFFELRRARLVDRIENGRNYR